MNEAITPFNKSGCGNDEWLKWHHRPTLFSPLQYVDVNKVNMEQKFPVVSKASELPGTNVLRFIVLSVTRGTASVVGRGVSAACNSVISCNQPLVLVT